MSNDSIKDKLVFQTINPDKPFSKFIDVNSLDKVDEKLQHRTVNLDDIERHLEEIDLKQRCQWCLSTFKKQEDLVRHENETHCFQNPECDEKEGEEEVQIGEYDVKQ